jgi:hypothetical protein
MLFISGTLKFGGVDIRELLFKYYSPSEYYCYSRLLQVASAAVVAAAASSTVPVW